MKYSFNNFNPGKRGINTDGERERGREEEAVNEWVDSERVVSLSVPHCR